MNEQEQPTQTGSLEPQQLTQPAVVGTPLGAAPQSSEPDSFSAPMGAPLGAVPTAPKKSKMPLIIALIVVVLAVVGAVAFLLLGKKSESPSSTQTTTTQQAETKKEPVTAESTIVALEAKAIELHKKQSEYTHEVSKPEQNYDPTSGIVYFKPSGVDYFVRSLPQTKGAFIHTYKPTSTDANAYDATNKEALVTQQAVIDYLTGTLGFSKEPGALTIDFAIETITYSTYKNGSVYCTLPDAEQLFGIQASCAPEEKLQAGAKEVAPLYAIYAKAVSVPTVKLYGGIQEDAGKNGYKILRLATETNYISFIKSATATDWKYAKPTRHQSLPNCTEFEYDTEVRLAYEGTPCSRNNKESTVTAK